MSVVGICAFQGPLHGFDYCQCLMETTTTMTMAELSWKEEISMDDYFHCLEGSPSNHTKTLGPFGIASVFCAPVIVSAQSEECEEGCDTITSIMDGTGHKEDGKKGKQTKTGHKTG